MKKLFTLMLAVVLCVCTLALCVAARDLSAEQKQAEELKQLGLFKGVSDTDFDLERAPTRVEAIVMLIRLLGKENVALDGTARNHPFTDVPDWANPYVAYAYESGLTKGVSETKFGEGNADAKMYLTFVLRALGFSDADGDFSWENPFDFAKEVGILPETVDTENFLRADAVTVSRKALEAKVKGDAFMLAESLIKAGTFNAGLYASVTGNTEVLGEPTSILFIGNSYTYYNDMPTDLFKSLAISLGENVEVEAITKGSHKLEWWADPKDEYGAKLDAALRSGKKYDYVILQERSLSAVDDKDSFYAAVRNIVKRVKAIGAEPILYSTWGRKKGSEALTNTGLNTDSMAYIVDDAYSELGKELGIKVAHVGLAFLDVYKNNSRIELYDSDKTHPSRAGSFLAASTIFATIFEKSPVGAPYTAGFNASVSDVLFEAAHKVALDGADEVTKILFIGNSYTFYNDMPTEAFTAASKAGGENVYVEAITKGSHALEWWADPNDEYGAKLEAALRSGLKYDYVVLQERSQFPVIERESFHNAVRNLAERIRAIGAEPILYCTWGRKTGQAFLANENLTNESMTYIVADAYKTIGEELDIKVAYVGLAFYDIYTTNDKIELYNADKTHPSVAGSLLAAVTIYSTIFDKDPTELPYFGYIASKENVSALLEAARKATFETPEIKKF